MNMAVRSENERNKAVVDEFYKAGIQGHLTRFTQHLHPEFTWTAPNYLPWGGTHTGAALFRDGPLSSLPDVFDFARFGYISVIAEDGHVDAVINQGVMGTAAVIQIVDCWTVRNGKVTSIWVAYFEPQALLDKLGLSHGLSSGMSMDFQRIS
jgi:ketosteroid isomerase-like protein